LLPIEDAHLSACHRAAELPPAEVIDEAHAAPPLAARRLALYAERRALARPEVAG
jgi:hypothetical protein